MKKYWFVVVLVMALTSMQAQPLTHYGRLYNVQDFIEHAPNDITGINRCLSTISQRIWQESGKTDDMSDLVYTIVFPQRTYVIQEAMGPIKIAGKSSKMIFERNMSGPFLNRRVVIQLIGLRVDNGTFKKALGQYVSQVQSEVKTDYSTNILDQFYWIAKGYMSNGIDISSFPALRSYIDAHSAKTNIQCNNNPASSNFLSAKPDPMPTIQSTSPERHVFFVFKTQGQQGEEPAIYPKTQSRTLHNTEIHIRGVKLEGISSTTNSHVYNPQSVQHNQTFNMGAACAIENFKGVNVRNVIVENLYGNGIFVNNKFFAYENNAVVVDSNILTNVWGIKYRKDCNTGSYDDTGFGIRFTGIQQGKTRYNIIHNNLAVTKQVGAIALGSCCEHDKDCEAGYNSLKGYDRLIHVENGLSGFHIHHNRCTGGETGIVFDGNRDYKGRSCPPVNPSLVEYNYISNEELVYNPYLQKIYPQHLFFSTLAHRTNEYNGTQINNNTFVIDKKLVFTYSTNNRSLCNSKDPRGHQFNDAIDRYHIKSGLRKQQIQCNVFRVLNASHPTSMSVGGTYLTSFCIDEIIDPSPCPVPSNEVPCGWVKGQTIAQNPKLVSGALGIVLRGNQYIDCDKVYLHHAGSSTETMYNNTFNRTPPKGVTPSYNQYNRQVRGYKCP